VRVGADAVVDVVALARSGWGKGILIEGGAGQEVLGAVCVVVI